MDAFLVLRKLGRGGFGEVYKALEKKTGKFVAIKKLIPTKGLDEERLVGKCSIEADIIGSVAHRNVIELRSYFEERNQNGLTVCQVYEFVDFDLHDVITCHAIQITDVQVAAIMKQLLDGLQFCHSKNIIHRDIKPQNILIRRDGVAKLADFGLSCIHTGDTLPNSSVGTIWYRPPELLGLEGPAYYTSAIDIWSLGCVLGEMIQRSPLFPGKTSMDQHRLMKNMLSIVTYTPSRKVGKRTSSTRMPTKINCQLSHSVTNLELIFTRLGISRAALELLKSMLTLHPTQRITATDAINCRWLTQINPMTTTPPDFRLLQKGMIPTGN